MENKAQQQLRDWLAQEGRLKGWLARQLHVDRATVSQWIGGKRLPHPANRAHLETITGGAVPAASWEQDA